MMSTFMRRLRKALFVAAPDGKPVPTFPGAALLKGPNGKPDPLPVHQPEQAFLAPYTWNYFKLKIISVQAPPAA